MLNHNTLFDMGKSKSGGTRSFIRGRVGADVYSIGRDSKGKKQQVVRSLAETVANPQTTNQMRGRMIMFTVMQALAALRPIVDHSFDGFTGKQPNISEFIARNYALVKADVAANPSTGNHFGLNMYQEKGAKRGQYIISAGNAIIPSALVLTKASGVIAITMPSDAVTVAGLKSALGMTSEEYFTLVGIAAENGALYERFRVNPNLADTTAITAENIAAVFATEGNASAQVSIADNVISITLADVATCCAVIISKKNNGSYIHNDAVLGDGSGFSYAADVALPSYPVGSADYLNGGDIYGESESFPEGGGDEPAPSITLQATTMKINDINIRIGEYSTISSFPDDVKVELTLTGTPTDGTCQIVSSKAMQKPVGTVITPQVSFGSITSLNFSSSKQMPSSGDLYIVDSSNAVVQFLGGVDSM